MSKARKRKFRQKVSSIDIGERRIRDQIKLRAKQSRNNKRFAKLRGLQELSFVFINTM
ncbi:hypothetical protein [Sulfurovum sp. NBC37-1]|uniref:hypothetical protein n=1 Tax=Sulfurovum sp. (strain NBC37-1) TaxID=387093 RepID=UPI0013050AB8|nr:hypothetical protein [Sulfurovum sp. NBC37-1]